MAPVKDKHRGQGVKGSMFKGQTRSESAMLVLQRGGEAGLTWTLERQTLTIGRNLDCTIVLEDRQVSRVHARILWREDHYEIGGSGVARTARISTSGCDRDPALERWR